MANPFAIHSVGSSLVTALRNAYHDYQPNTGDPNITKPSCDFRLLSSGEMATADTGNLPTTLSLFLYRITMNEYLRNTGSSNSALDGNIPLSVDLHYLMIVWASNAEAEHFILGWAMRQLHLHPVLDISALSSHANMLHPNPQISRQHLEEFHDAVRLAVELGVDRVITFAGCPGDSDDAKQPNWVTCPWPPEYLKVLDWQWNRVVSPYWIEHAKFAADHGVKIAIEMHPGFVVYSPETMLKLRSIAGDSVGCNYDPSHMFWQGIDPIKAVRVLGDSIFHVHAKDTQIYDYNLPKTGVLDTKKYTDERNHAWIFRACGYGHPYGWLVLVALIGIGLIGSSLARVLRSSKLAGEIVACDRGEETLDKVRALALADRVTADQAEAVKGADLVVISTPLSAYAEIGRRIGVTKNAVIGKVHRLGLAGRATATRSDRPRLPSAPRLSMRSAHVQAPVIEDGDLVLPMQPG